MAAGCVKRQIESLRGCEYASTTRILAHDAYSGQRRVAGIIEATGSRPSGQRLLGGKSRFICEVLGCPNHTAKMTVGIQA